MGLLNQLYLDYQKSAQHPHTNEQTTQELKDKFFAYLNSSPPPADLYEQDENGYSILAYAAFYDDTETFRSVLSKMKRFEVSDVRHYFRALLCSANKGNDTHISLLLAHGASINAVNEDGVTCLHMAACNGDIIPTRKLLNHGAVITAFVKLFPEQVATDGSMSIFDFAFSSKNPEIKQKVAVINYLFLWAWSKNITVDLTGIKIDPTLIEHLIVLNALIYGSPVARYTPSFEHAVTNFDELLQSPDVNLNEKDIYQAIGRRIVEGDKHPLLEEYASKMRERLLSKTPVEIKDVIRQTLFAQSASIPPNAEAFKKAKEGLSAELGRQFDNLVEELAITPSKTADAQHATPASDDRARIDTYKYL